MPHDAAVRAGRTLPDSYFDYDAPDYVPPGLVPVPRPFTDYDYAPYDYDYDYGDYDYAGTGTGAAAARGRRRGGDGDAGRSRGSASRVPLTGREPGGTLGDARSVPGVPGLAQHIAYAGDGVGAAAGRRASWFPVRPGEWGLAYLQLASLKRTSPGTLAHITVLTYDRATRARRARLSATAGTKAWTASWMRRFSRRGEALADASASTAEKKLRLEETESLTRLRAALSWRKVHAAFELLQQNTPVVLLDADVVFLKDPTASWRDAMRRYAMSRRRAGGRRGRIASQRGHERDSASGDAQDARAGPTVAEGRVRVCRVRRNRAWRHFRHFRGRGPRRPARAYFNYALRARGGRPRARARLGRARTFANFLTAHRGADSAFDGVVAVGRRVLRDARGQGAAACGARWRRRRGRRRTSPGKRRRRGRREARLPGRGRRTARRRGRLRRLGARRRAARIVERKKTRAKKRAKGLPLISSVDTQTRTPPPSASPAGTGLDAGSDDASDWPPSRGSRGGDGAKRKAAFRGEYRVTEDRRGVGRVSREPTRLTERVARKVVY